MDSEKRLVVAIAISVAILVIFGYLAPEPEPVPVTAPAEFATSETERPTTGRPEVEAPRAEEPDAPMEEAAVAADAEQEIVVANGVYEVAFTNRGGRARTWTLQYYTTGDGRPLQLFPRFTEASELPLAVDLDDASLARALNDALYRVEREPIATAEDGTGGERITFSWSDGRGLTARKSFEFRQGDYLVDVRLDVTDRGRRVPARLTVGPGFAAQEPSSSHSNYYYESQAVWDIGGQVTRQKRGKLEGEGGFDAPALWAGLEDQYFAALIVPNASPARVRWRTPQLTAIPVEAPAKDEAVEARPEPVLAVSVTETGARLFIGPKQFTLLRAIGEDRDLQKAVWFSSQNWLRVIVRYLFLGLVWLHDNVAQNWGVAIILATVLLRLVLFPVNQYSMVSMKRTQLQMQKLQPKVKAIRNKYKKAKDAQSKAKMNQEMMELYRQEGVNPMGGLSGCLPLLAQFPILIGFYNMLTVAVELRGAPFFGWIHDLSQEDPFWILPLLMSITMFVQQKLAMSKIKDPQQLQQQKMMLFMPVVFGFICLQMPSGLVLYWFVNNLLGIGQQWLVNRHTGRLEAAEQKA